MMTRSYERWQRREDLAGPSMHPYISMGWGAALLSVTICLIVKQASTVMSMEPHGFTIIDAFSGDEVGPISDGGTIDLAMTGHLFALRANFVGRLDAEVRFHLDGAEVVVGEPYFLAGMHRNVTGGAFLPPGPSLSRIGRHTVSATPSWQERGQIISGATLTIDFYVKSAGNNVRIQSHRLLEDNLPVSHLVIIHADFDEGADGFRYIDEPWGFDTFDEDFGHKYAIGNYSETGGVNGSGGLRVALGGFSTQDVFHGMSGGFYKGFATQKAGYATISFSYQVEFSDAYEYFEVAYVLCMIDGQLIGTGGGEHVDFTTKGKGSIPWTNVTIDVGVLYQGRHTLTIGGHNNQKTDRNERSIINIDNVLLTTTDSLTMMPSGPPNTAPAPESEHKVLLQASFVFDPEGFTYTDDPWGLNTEEEFAVHFASGSYDPTGGVAGGGLHISLGGISTSDILHGMSGAFHKSFTMYQAGMVTISFYYSIDFSSGYDAGEYSEVICMVDGLAVGADDRNFVARTTKSTGSLPWTVARLDVGLLFGGPHVLTIGGHNNQKTHIDEKTDIFFDNILILSSDVPSTRPSILPSTQPTTTSSPTPGPTGQPTTLPTSTTPTGDPTSGPTGGPTTTPPTTSGPSTRPPTVEPMSSLPTDMPSTLSPTIAPSSTPSTGNPTLRPTLRPTMAPPPTIEPSTSPTMRPSSAPITGQPSEVLTALPTLVPTPTPTTNQPSLIPTTIQPTTVQPTLAPTTLQPTAALTTRMPTPRPSSAGSVLLQSSFDMDADGFVYLDDPWSFLDPDDVSRNYVDGTYSPFMGETGGGLHLTLGGQDLETIFNMTGGFYKTFYMPLKTMIGTLSLSYRIQLSGAYEVDEYSEVLVMVGDTFIGTQGNRFIDVTNVFRGNVSWTRVTLDVGLLNAGWAYNLTIGGYNNKKTFANEFTDIYFDDVILTVSEPPTPAPTGPTNTPTQKPTPTPTKTATPTPPVPPSWLIVPTTGELQNRHEACFVMVHEKGYLIGGRRAKRVDIYDPGSRSWSAGANPNIEVHHMQCVGVDDLVYLASAWTAQFPTEENLDVILVYNTTSDSWFNRTALPEYRRRGGGSAVLVGRDIYVTHGNRGGHGAHATTLGWTDKYNVDTDTWTVELADAPNPRDHTGGALMMDGRICVAAGRDGGDGNFFNAVILPTDCYDPVTNTWTVEADIPQGRAGAAYGTTCDGMLMVAGGEGSDRAYDNVDVFDGTSWTTIDNLNQARHGTGLAISCFCNQIHIASGSGALGGSPELGTVETLFPGGVDVACP